MKLVHPIIVLKAQGLKMTRQYVLPAADESKFKGDEGTINDNSGKSEFDSIGGQGQVNDDRLQDRHQ